MCKTLKGLDTATDTSGKAHALADAGIQVVALYLRKDRASREMVRGLHSVGIKIVSIWEKGAADHRLFYNKIQAEEDAAAAIDFAAHIEQPKGTAIFPTVDFDANADDLDGRVGDYLMTFHDRLKAAGYLMGVYGNGLVCEWALRTGYAHYTWLAMARGWGGYQSHKDEAHILQTVGANVCGFQVDMDEIRNPEVAW